MSIIRAALSSVVVCLAVVVTAAATVSAPKQILTDRDKTDAVQVGTKQKGRLTGLSLIDSGQSWVNALDPQAATNTGFSLRVYTPTTWVQQQAADAAKFYRPFTLSEITEEMLEPVLRVVVYPDKPTKITGRSLAFTSSAEHVVLRDTAKALVVQPLSEEPFTDTVSSAFRDAAFVGLVATFPLEAVQQLRGPTGDKEFLIVVVGEGRRERQFKVKEKHFERLP